MSGQQLRAGKQWVERRFVEIAREFGAPRTLTQEDRWRVVDTPFMPHSHCMAYYIEMAGRLKRGDLTFRDADIEVAAAGGLRAQERLSHHIREVLVTLRSLVRPGDKSTGPMPLRDGSDGHLRATEPNDAKRGDSCVSLEVPANAHVG